MKGHKDSSGKFHPHTPYNGVRKSRDQSIKTQGVKLTSGIRMQRELPTELSGFKNINMIEDEDVRNNMISTLTDMRRIFVKNDMDGGMIWRFLEECVNGQILISLGKNDKQHYTNKLHDFYIDDRVGFKGMRELYQLRDDLESELKQIVKYDKPKFVVGDIVKPDASTGNVALQDALKEKPDITFKIMEMTRGLDPHYIGYEIVDVDKKPFKKNWIYAGSDNLVQGGIN